MDLYMAAAFVGLAAALSARWMSLRTGRVVFWAGAATASVSVFLMGISSDWRSGLAMALFVASAIIGSAYVNTEFIAFGGRTYKLFTDLKGVDNYGGGLTANKAWWLLTSAVTLLMVFGTERLLVENQYRIPAVVAALIALFGLSFGYRDANMAKRVAAGQRIQLGLLSVVSVGIFPLSYLCAYRASRHWWVKRQAVGRHQR